MDSTPSNEEVTTEDLQAGVIRAIFKSRSHFKRFKDCFWPEASSPKPGPAELSTDSVPSEEREGS